MIIKKPSRNMEFCEHDEEYIKKLAGDIGCQYAKVNKRTYNLNKLGSDSEEKTGVFAWIHKEGEDYFWATTRKIWVDQAKARIPAGGNTSGLNCLPKDNHYSQDSVCFDIKDDYQKAIMALSMIKDAY